MFNKTLIINFCLFVLLFFLSDLIFSNFIYKDNISHRCNKILDDGKFYALQENCNAKMRVISSIKSFKVHIDKYGNRFSGKYINNSNENIYFIGDSQTFGLGSNWNDTFVGIIESKKKNYKIVNLGVPSYSPSVYTYILYKLHENNKLNSNKVFLLIDLTDVADESIRWRSDQNNIKPFLSSSIKLKKINAVKSFKRKNLKGSHMIATFLRENGRSIRKRFKNKQNNKNHLIKANKKGTWPGRFTFTKFSELEECDLSSSLNNPWTCGGVEKGLKQIRKKVKKFGEIIKLTNSEFYIITFPWPETLAYGQDIFNWENFMSELCNESQCKKVINLFPEFKEVKQKRENDWLDFLYVPGDFHLTKKGNELVATKILKEAF